MNILMIYPKMPSTFWTMDHLVELMGKKASYPPLGLLTVAAMLPKTWNKRLVDLNICDVDVGDDLSQVLPDKLLAWADFAFVGAMNVQSRSAHEVISHCKAKGLKVVAGGPLFTHEWERFTGVDHFILNEAEITLPLFLADLDAGKPQPLYATKDFANVHETPVPQWDLCDMDQYAYMIVQYSRGCPYMCDFCDVTALFGRKPRVKTPEQIIAELNAMGDLGRFGMVLFADDNLIGNRKHLRESLLPAVIDWRARTKPPIGFATQVTINLADDDELSRLMLEAGFRHIFCGIETPDEEALLASQKRQNTKRDLLANVKKLQHDGYIVTAGFIVGFDADTEASFQRMVDFIQDSGIVIATINLLKAPPGTELFTKMRNAGRLIEPFDFDENESNIIPVMDPAALHAGFDFVLRHVYSAAYVYARARTLLEAYPGAKVKHPIRRKPTLRAVAILARILWRLGIASPDRGHFWSLFVWTLRHRRRMMEYPFFFAGLALQFRRMYERYDATESAKKMAKAVVEMPVASLSDGGDGETAGSLDLKKRA
jgi:radical SAM superfamily enzyme YgiQ (UPF0313 family)